MTRGDASPQLLAEVGGVLAGTWFARPGADVDNLVASGLLLSGHIDNSTLLGWIRAGWERSSNRNGPGSIPS